jgi:hypothetical protein
MGVDLHPSFLFYFLKCLEAIGYMVDWCVSRYVCHIFIGLT